MNNISPQNNKIKNVLDKIKKNELTLKPKAVFQMKFMLLILIVIAIIFVTLFLSSFIMFSIRASGQRSLIGFGPHGWQVFLLLFPWKLVILEALLVIVLEYMLRSFRFGYKVPVLYLLGGVLALMIVCGIVVDRTSLHTVLLHQADQHHLPGPVRSLYEGTRRPPPGGHDIYRGIVTSISGNTLDVELATSTVKVILPAAPENVHVSDRIFIRGKLINGEIHAEGVRNANQVPPPLRQENR